jgi:hypothetical protein
MALMFPVASAFRRKAVPGANFRLKAEARHWGDRL